jgi:ABC-type polysaccharide transport system permease subunit
MPNVQVFETWIYDWGLLRGNYGMATAMGLFQTMFGIVLSLFANYLVGKIGYEVLW